MEILLVCKLIFATSDKMNKNNFKISQVGLLKKAAITAPYEGWVWLFDNQNWFRGEILMIEYQISSQKDALFNFYQF